MKNVKDNTTWSFSGDDLFASLGFSNEEAKLLKPATDVFVNAIIETLQMTPSRDLGQTIPSASVPLFIPGKRYHISLRKAFADTLADSVKTVSIAWILHSLRLMDLSVTLSVRTLVTMVMQITRLTDAQRKMITRILRLKKTSSSRTYWPSTKVLAKSLRTTQKKVTSTLDPLKGKVVGFDSEKQTWRVLW